MNGEYKVYTHTSGGIAPRMKEYFPQVEEATRFTWFEWNANLIMHGTKARIDAGYTGAADSSFFHVLDRKCLAGNITETLDVKGNAVVSFAVAKKIAATMQGGTMKAADKKAVAEKVIGEQFSVAGWGNGYELTISGVFEDYPLNSSFRPQVFISLSTTGMFIYDGTDGVIGNDRYSTFLKLRKASDADGLNGNFGGFISTYLPVEQMKAAGIHCRMLFLEADNQSIINRYKETRRTHPLAGGGVSVAQALQKERALLQPVRDHADFVLNTSGFSASKLHSEILNLFSDASLEDGMHVNVLSFGFKNGIPVEADLVMDVRFMPNPYYIEELKHKTGLDDGVRDYVFSFSQTNEFMRRMEEMMSFLLPLYSEEGKTVLVLAIGCTGGHHRSVAVAHALAEYIQNAGYPVTETHRDITR